MWVDGYAVENDNISGEPNFDKAKIFFEEGRDLGSSDCGYELGIIERKLKNHEQAFAHFLDAATNEHVESAKLVAYYYKDIKENANAARWFVTAVDLDPNNNHLKLAAADFLYAINDFKSAINYYQQLDQNDDYNGTYRLGKLCATGPTIEGTIVIVQDEEKAIAYYQKTAELNVSDADIMLEIGEYFHKKKMFIEAIEAVKKILAWKNVTIQNANRTHYMLGVLYAVRWSYINENEKGNEKNTALENSLLYLKKATNSTLCETQKAHACYLLGIIYLDLASAQKNNKQYIKEAISYLEKCKTNPEATLELAKLYADKNKNFFNKQKSIDYYKTTKELYEKIIADTETSGERKSNAQEILEQIDEVLTEMGAIKKQLPKKPPQKLEKKKPKLKNLVRNNFSTQKPVENKNSIQETEPAENPKNKIPENLKNKQSFFKSIRTQQKNEHFEIHSDINVDTSDNVKFISNVIKNHKDSPGTTHQCFVHGSKVRNPIIEKFTGRVTPSFDTDLITDLTPDEIMGLFKEKETIKKIEIICRRHPLVCITFANDERIELSTFRERIPDDARVEKDEHGIIRAHKGYSNSMAKDMYNHDFTLNMCYHDISTGKTFISHEGLQDIRSKTLRFIIDPVTQLPSRLIEDPLLIVKVARFVELGFALPETDKLFIVKYKEHLCYIKPERVIAELNNVIRKMGSLSIIKILNDLDCLTEVVTIILRESHKKFAAAICQRLLSITCSETKPFEFLIAYIAADVCFPKKFFEALGYLDGSLFSINALFFNIQKTETLFNKLIATTLSANVPPQNYSLFGCRIPTGTTQLPQLTLTV